MSKREKIWYSNKGKPYTGNFPAFFNTSEFDWVKPLEAKFPAIRQEVIQYIGKHRDALQPYFNTDLVSKKNAWQLLNLKFWGIENKKTIANFPALSNAVLSIPGVVSGGISLMEPQTTILPHVGDTNAVIRCHLGIDIPAELPVCGIKVNNEQRSWHNGEVLMFCDAYEHSAWNHSDQRRIVVIFDIVHRGLKKSDKTICVNALSLLWLQKKRLDSRFIDKLPGPVLGVLLRMRRVYLHLFGLKHINP